MRPFVISGLAFFAGLALLFSLSGRAPSFTVSGTSRNYQSPVEQQTPGGATQPDRSLWVVNNTGCAWDSDDQQSRGGNGYVESGQTVSFDLCVIGDAAGQAHLVVAQACALRKDEGFRVALSYDLSWSQRGVVEIVPPAVDGCAKVCAVGPKLDSQSGYLEPIANSNGGVGQRTTYTLSLTNTGPRKRAFQMSTYMTLAASQTESACGGVYPIILNGTCLPWIDINEPELCWT